VAAFVECGDGAELLIDVAERVPFVLTERIDALPARVASPTHP
jgi:hypothetical protein